MSLLSLFQSERGFVATERLVYTPDEFVHVQHGLELAERLDTMVAGESQRLEQASQQAQEQGKAEGFQQGRDAASAELAERLHGFDQAHRQEIDQLRANTTSLALEMVRRIAADVAPADWLAAQAARAAEELIEHAPLSLRVHPDHADAVRASLADKACAFDDVVADDTLAPDACTIESRVGRVDASLNSQLERLGQIDLDTGGSST